MHPKIFISYILLFVATFIPSFTQADIYLDGSENQSGLHETIDGEMSCKITQVSHLESNDGKPVQNNYIAQLINQRFLIKFKGRRKIPNPHSVRRKAPS